jgi:hypothetical protein
MVWGLDCCRLGIQDLLKRLTGEVVWARSFAQELSEKESLQYLMIKFHWNGVVKENSSVDTYRPVNETTIENPQLGRLYIFSV